VVKKTDTLGELIQSHPESAPLLAQAGLHCIGCHVSAYESLEEGCLAHGLDKAAIDALVVAINARIKEYDSLPKAYFSPLAVEKLEARRKKSKFVRIVQSFNGFDFEPSDSKEADELEIEVSSKKKNFSVLASPRLERMLRGLKIDFDRKTNDFEAKRC